MSAPIVFGIIASVFGILPIILRTNAIYMLLALCAGEVLARLTAQDVTQIASSFITADIPLYSIVQITLLLIAPLLVLFWYRKAAKSDIVLQIIAAVATAVLCVMFVVAKLPYEPQNVLQSAELYVTLKPFFSVAIASGVFVSLLWFWIKKPKREKAEDKKHHK